MSGHGLRAAQWPELQHERCYEHRGSNHWSHLELNDDDNDDHHQFLDHRWADYQRGINDRGIDDRLIDRDRKREHQRRADDVWNDRRRDHDWSNHRG